MTTIIDKKGNFDGEMPEISKSIGSGVASFFSLVSISVIIGLFYGVSATLITKNHRAIAHSSILETSLFLSFGMLSYFTAEVTG